MKHWRQLSSTSDFWSFLLTCLSPVKKPHQPDNHTLCFWGAASLIQSELSGGAISLQLMWNNETQFTVTVWNSPHCQLQADRSTGAKLSIHPSPLIQGQVFGKQMKRRSPDLPLPTKLIGGNSQVSVLGRPRVLLLVGHTRTPDPTQLAPQQVSSNKRQNYCMNDSPGYVMVKKQQQKKRDSFLKVCLTVITVMWSCYLKLSNQGPKVARSMDIIHPSLLLPQLRVMGPVLAIIGQQVRYTPDRWVWPAAEI